MFTGIVEEVGSVSEILIGSKSARIKINANIVKKEVKIGDSISTNGVCLTVTELLNDGFIADIMGETIKRSNLGLLKKGDKVNLERALKLEDRLGGHIVSGHIDGTGIIKEVKKEENSIWISIESTEDILKYIVFKGSITIDGVSLTVAYVDKKIFKVSIVPHTQRETILKDKGQGDKVNLECDILGKYIEKLIKTENREDYEKSSIDINFLNKHGFM